MGARTAATPKWEDGPDLTTEEAAAEIGLTPNALRVMRHRGRGPAYYKTSPGRSGRVRYRRRAITAWREACTVDPAA